VILLGSKNKYNVGTEMHVFMLEIMCFCWFLRTNVMLELKYMCLGSKLYDSSGFQEQR